MTNRSRVAVFILVSLLITGLAQAQQLKPHPEYVVTTSWLAEHMNDPKLVIVHVGGADGYKTAHIPGARSLQGNKFMVPTGPFPPDDQLKATLEGIGISDDSRVVIYSPDWGPIASRLFFTLDYVGFHNAALLDGGIEKWQEEKRRISTDEPTVTKGTLTFQPNPELVVKLDTVKQLVNSPPGNTVILDARPKRRYRSGHIAGAMPMFWESNLVDADAVAQVLKSPAELQKMYIAAGLTPGKKVVSYCEVGWQASYAYFIARYLGYDAAVYHGSWSEWSKEKQPSIRGDSLH